MRAAVRGAINFRESCPRDPWWWRRVYTVLREIARQDDRQLLEQHLQLELALLSGNVTADSFKAAQARALRRLMDLHQLTYPWDKTSARFGSRDEALDLYKQRIGDPNTPAFQRLITAELERLKKEEVEAQSFIVAEDSLNVRLQQRSRHIRQTQQAASTRPRARTRF